MNIVTCVTFCAHAQIITNFAGTSLISGYSGDGAPATAALMRFPSGLAFDNAGNVYIADQTDNRVRKVNSAGTITTIAGDGTWEFGGDGGPATAARFSSLFDIGIDANENIYISDMGNQRIRKIDTNGVITTIAGDGTVANTGDGGPATAAAIACNGIDVDDSGNVYLATNGQIRFINASTGIITTIIGTSTGGFSGDGGPATAADFSFIRDVAVGRNRNIYIVDQGNQRIRMVDTSGIVNTIAGDGTYGSAGDGGLATAAQLAQPECVYADEAGCVYIVDRNNYKIRKIDPLGVITTIAGSGALGSSGDGGPATAADFNYMRCVAKKKGGNIFIAERNNRVVRMVTDTNHAVHFSGGHTLSFNVCIASISIDTLLAATDTDTGQVDIRVLISGPQHGTVAAAYTTYTTGTTLVPAGLSYAPAPGYVGYDTFSVRVTDGYTSDTTTIYVRVDTALPYAGGITGADSVCIGDTIMLADTITGGTWSVKNTNAAVAGSIITGVAVGIDTVLYIVTNACGMDTAIHIVGVKACVNGVATQHSVGGLAHLQVWPNPGEGTFTVTLPFATGQAHIVVTNTLGEIVKEITISGNSTTLNLDVPAGIYFVNAVTTDGIWSGKVVVQK